MKYRNIMAILLAGCLMAALTACGGNETTSTESISHQPTVQETSTETEPETMPKELEFDPEVSGIYIMRDGTIKTAEIESFDNKDYTETRYDESVLREYVTGWIKDYNEAKGRNEVALEKLEVKDKKATLVIRYDSYHAFLEFQGADFGFTDVETGNAEYAAWNYQLTNLMDAQGKNVTPAEALADETLTVVKISGTGLAYLSGEVKFLSSSQTLVAPNCVRLQDKGVSFIFFK